MRAAILTRFRAPFELVDDVQIDDPGPGEVLVRVTHCGVCHTDYSAFSGADAAFPLPVILGHEAAGVIHAVGPGVTSRTVGQHVMLSMRAPCGQCFQCTRGQPMLCERAPSGGMKPRLMWRGAPVFRAFRLGAFAEFALAEVEGAVPVADSVAPEVAAVVGCAVQTGVGAVSHVTQVGAGESVLVIGAGTVGICVLQGAALHGATTLIAIDPNESRRQQALALGATHAFAPDEPDLLARIRALTAGRGVDHAFDLVCTDGTPQWAMDALRPGGHAVLIGVKAKETQAPLLTTPMIFQQKRLSGCMLGNCLPQRDFPHFLHLWQAGRLAIDRLITARRPLAEIDQAFADLEAGVGLRTVLSI